jgi:hypothetical protein
VDDWIAIGFDCFQLLDEKRPSDLNHFGFAPFDLKAATDASNGGAVARLQRRMMRVGQTWTASNCATPSFPMQSHRLLGVATKTCTDTRNGGGIRLINSLGGED